MAEQMINNHPEEAADLNELLRIRRDKLTELQNAGADPFVQVRFERTHHTTDITSRFEELEGQTVRLAGRMMSKRIMGKLTFADLSDRYGRLQLCVKRDLLGTEEYKAFKKLDIGDLIGVAGEVFRTQKGEISVRVEELVLLSKNLIPLPEKWHGLKDTDTRYRQRYVDLIINPEVRSTFEKRSAIVREIRRFMDGRGFMEVETPCLNTIPGGAAARPFITHHNALDIDMYMRIATELHLKRLIVGGMERVYEVGRIFRNEGMDTKHNPEFTTVELYEAYADFNDMMDLFEDFLSSAAQNILGTYQVQWQGEDIDLSPGWRRLTMAQAVEEYLGVDFMAIPEDAAAVAAANGYCMPQVDSSDAVTIVEGRHPVVEKVLKNTPFVPNDTYMGEQENRVSIITDPNMAGKSTYMRQVALITLMAQIGSFVPARTANIGITDAIFTRVGASDDLATGQSTFLVEMNEV